MFCLFCSLKLLNTKRMFFLPVLSISIFDTKYFAISAAQNRHSETLCPGTFCAREISEFWHVWSLLLYKSYSERHDVLSLRLCQHQYHTFDILSPLHLKVQTEVLDVLASFFSRWKSLSALFWSACCLKCSVRIQCSVLPSIFKIYLDWSNVWPLLSNITKRDWDILALLLSKSYFFANHDLCLCFSVNINIWLFGMLIASAYTIVQSKNDVLSPLLPKCCIFALIFWPA